MIESQLTQGMNPQQKEAILTTEGPLLVMAGAGSGKTRVLTYRIAHLVQDCGVKAWRILAITFTNKAAKEMKERIEKLIGEEAEGMWISTFHSMCVRILRRECEYIGYTKNFSIADPSEQKTVMKKVLKTLNIDSKKYPERMILGKISQAKNDLKTPKDLADEAEDFIGKMVADCYKGYQDYLEESQAMDFDDLIMKTVQLFESQSDRLAYYQDKFQYIHVDEYQDTNEAQDRLVSLLAKGHQNVCVVGDADQSIYGWRGANMENILNFEERFKKAKTILLEQNYRSTQTILDAANSVIKHNFYRKVKNLWTDNKKGDLIKLYNAQSERDEAYNVIQTIQDLKDKGNRSLNDFAILYRTNAQSRVFEDALLRSSIPYRLIGGQRFFDRKEVKDILAYLKLAVNPLDNLSFTRVINEPKRGVGPASLEKLANYATQAGLSLLEAAGQDVKGMGAKAKASLKEFADLIQRIRRLSEEKSLKELLQETMEISGYSHMLKSQEDLEGQSRLENLEELLSAASQFEQHADPDSEESLLVQFLTDLALVTDNQEEEEVDEKVTLMTLHAAKGLEFPVVFLVGLEEGIFPLGRAVEDPDELEEERRLAYVGITRAEEALYLSRAYSRMMYGQTKTNRKSRFLDEIDANLIEQPEEETWVSFKRTSPAHETKMPSPYANRKEKSLQRSSSFMTRGKATVKTPSDVATGHYQAGDKVKHKKWGMGTVVKVTGAGNDQQIDVAFPNGVGVKRLLAAFAPLSKV